MLIKRIANDNHIHGKNKLSVGCVSELLSVPGFRIKRNVIIVMLSMRKTMKRKKIIVPMVVRPLNRCGCWLIRFDIPPVDIVNVNHAQVKCEILSRSDIFPL